MISVVILDYSTADVYRVWIPEGVINNGDAAIYDHCNSKYNKSFKAINCYWMAKSGNPSEIIKCIDLQ